MGADIINVTGEIGWLLAQKKTNYRVGTAYFDDVVLEAPYDK